MGDDAGEKDLTGPERQHSRRQEADPEGLDAAPEQVRERGHEPRRRRGGEAGRRRGVAGKTRKSRERNTGRPGLKYSQ